MKTLTLVRHAKSDWDDGDQRDFDRGVNSRGRRAARTVGAWLKRQGWPLDDLVASPAVRVVETLKELTVTAALSLEPRWDRRIYVASSATLMEVLEDTPDAASDLLLAGHNPGLEDLVLGLCGAGERLVAVAEKFPTVSVARIALPVDRWSDLRDGIGTLTDFMRPRDLDPSLGPDSR